MRLQGWLWSIALAGMTAFSVVQLVRGQAIQTDLLAMLPDTEKNPVAEQAIKSLAKATGERAVFLVRASDPERSKAAALRMAQALTGSGAFQEVTAKLPPIDPSMVARFYAPYAPRLATPDDGLQPVLESLKTRIESRLASPQGGFSGVAAAVDPLGALDDFLAGLPLMSTRLEVQDDLLVIHSPEGLYVLFSGGLRGSAFDPEVQKQVLVASRAAEKDLHSAYPEARLLHTGAVFYAADARESAEREMNLISSCSMLCIILLFVFAFRTVRHLLLGLLGVAAGFVAATTVCLLVFGKLYLLTLVCGSSVMGVAVDYTFLYFANHLGAGQSWQPRAALKRLLPALSLGLFTTLLGYAALLVAPFPGLRQIAVFSLVGLVAAFLTVLCLCPDALVQPLPARPRLFEALSRLLGRGTALARHRRALLLLASLTLLMIACAFKVRTDDQVRGLIQPSRALLAEEARITELTGLSNSGVFFLVEGSDEAQLLSREEALRSRLQPLVQSGELDGFQAISSFVPSPGRQDASLRRQRELAPHLVAAMAAVGFRPEIAKGLQAGLAVSPPLTTAAWFQTPFSVPYRMLWLGPTAHGMASMVYPMGTLESASLRQAVAGLPGVSLVDKAGSVSSLLGHYRWIASWALGGAILLIWLVVIAVYGLRSGTAVVLPAVLGILFAVAGSAVLGAPLTLFSTLGLILVLGFGVDYTVFLREGGLEDASSLLGVLLASLATLISYGLLIFSHTPVLRGFGLAVALGVLASTLLSFLALAPRSKVKP